MTDRQIIRLLAKEFGDYHSPSWYKTEAKRRYNRDISNSNICKTLGNYSLRKDNSTAPMKTQAKQFLRSCGWDLPLAQHILREAL